MFSSDKRTVVQNSFGKKNEKKSFFLIRSIKGILIPFKYQEVRGGKNKYFICRYIYSTVRGQNLLNLYVINHEKQV
jgi:hypothetical protein